MGKPDRHDERWDALVAWLRRVRGGQALTLQDAQRCFAAAPDESLTAEEIRDLVAIAVGGLVAAGQMAHRDTAATLVFSADTLVTAGEWSGLSDVVGLHPRHPCEELVTDVNSLSVDTRRLRLSRAVEDLRLGSSATKSLVLDVGPGWDSLAGLYCRDDRGGIVSWDARLEGGDWDSLQCAVSSSTWCDFADYSDEAVQDLWRN